MKEWPALDVAQNSDLLLAEVDEFGPTAVEERGASARIFFPTAAARDAALATLGRSGVGAIAVEVPDEDWAARSQRNLTPVTVGRITVLPARHPESVIPKRDSETPTRVTVVIEPSMGFGTGHHSTTRLCLAALQQMDLNGATVLDVGTGSGILAIAALRLGAVHVVGIDSDPDAIASANENLRLNEGAEGLTFAIADLNVGPLPCADIVLANLTGATLIRSADALLGALNPGGTLILSGILATEAYEVHAAFARAALRDRQHEDEWVCLTMTKPRQGSAG